MHQTNVVVGASFFRCVSSAAQSDCVRRPIGLRSPPNQIAFAIQSDCVRCPIGLRSVHDDLSLCLSMKKGVSELFNRSSDTPFVVLRPMVLSLLSAEEQHNELRCEDTQEHTQRINRRIADSRSLA